MAGRFKFPSNEEDWRRAAKNAKLENANINEFRDMHSASKATVAQFLVLKILVEENPFKQLARDAPMWNLDAFIPAAQHELNTDFPEFWAYLRSVRADSGATMKGQGDPLQLGMFEIPRENERQVMDRKLLSSYRTAPSNSHQTSIVPTRDEETVNISLIEFLQAVSLKVPGALSRWTPTRLVLRASFRSSSYEAHIDGALCAFQEPERAQALVECKALQREDTETQTAIQEALEVGAFLQQKDRPPSGDPGRICVISQNRNERYITLGTVDRHYLNYLNGTDQTSRFLTLHRYGPWMIDNADHLENFATNVLAFVLRVGDGR
ncbi:hypothetical protein BO70DRAFT_393926 [Aspergillus heteromorphus CBS 117.55]|uniref:Uncharacterized protein n=1 Tax=Aspergillus heteromorphus CBS 117.55 TaxID=1448321 RepID=A0A317WSA0_9EURO|nr:uncharacterized protein BO70DRAFT_393926 [Aspergillus heteromorphus CBS 117.55]PWY88202.1 hypothetical protein BO70DRAFT_393926 [Aspergillus heteromorphus CBS 117.55]